MPSLRTCLLLTVLIIGSHPAFAVCPHTPVDPYTGHLNIVSKYDPTDPTRSTLAEPDPESQAIHNQINQYARYLATISDYYVNTLDSRRKGLVLECMDLWLNHWADQDALITDQINHTGYAVRSWALSTIASASYQVIEHSQNQWSVTPNVARWLKQVTHDNSAYYYERTFQTPEKVNNHDYWAAWAATATGLVTDDRDLLDWAYSILVFSLDQGVMDSQTGMAYWPNEVRRARLGAYYSHFALSPVVAMAILLPQEGYVLHKSQYDTLTQLAEFAATFTLSPVSVQHINAEKQVNMNGSLLYWSKIYNTTFNNTVTRSLQQTFAQQIRPLAQLGGDVSHLFAPKN